MALLSWDIFFLMIPIDLQVNMAAILEIFRRPSNDALK